MIPMLAFICSIARARRPPPVRHLARPRLRCPKGLAERLAREPNPLTQRLGEQPLWQISHRRSPRAISFDRLAQRLRQRLGLAGRNRHHGGDHAGAQPLDAVAMADDGDAERRTAIRSTSKVRSITSPIRLGTLKSHSMCTNGNRTDCP